MKNSIYIKGSFGVLLGLLSTSCFAQRAATSEKGGQEQMRPEDTEVWEPVPRLVSPGERNFYAPSSDAVILFDGKSLSEWENVKDGAAAGWTLGDGYFTVDKKAGDIQTKRKFRNYQLHIEWRIPEDIDYSGQARGNSGVFLAATDGNAGGYEIQVLDGYQNLNETYVNGMVGSIYKEHIPLVNPARKPGEWNAYDIIWTAPIFGEDGSVKEKARITAFLNGVLIQHEAEVQGETAYIGKHEYVPHGPAPIKLQAHGDPSKPIDYRNIWLREL